MGPPSSSDYNVANPPATQLLSHTSTYPHRSHSPYAVTIYGNTVYAIYVQFFNCDSDKRRTGRFRLELHSCEYPTSEYYAFDIKCATYI